MMGAFAGSVNAVNEVKLMRYAVTFATFCLWLALPHFAVAAAKITIEIVESTMRMEMVDITVPATPEQIDTQCNPTGTDCKTTVTPATPPTSAKRPVFQFSAKVILPDGSHASLLCLAGDNNCAGFPPQDPQKPPPSSCKTEGNITTCTGQNLGAYQAKRDKDNLVIDVQKGKRRYRIVGSW